MKNEMCYCENENRKGGKWFAGFCAVVGFLGMATVLTLWLCKKYRKCTLPFHDDGSIDCDKTSDENG